MTQRPVSAWIELLGHDQIQVFVNGKRVSGRVRAETQRTAAVLVDITPDVQIGRNSIAVHAKQITRGRRPAVACRGVYVYANGQEYHLSHPDSWRVSNVFERRGTYWYDTEFEDGHWLVPRVEEPQELWGLVDVPPQAIRQPFLAPWIRPQTTRHGKAVLAGRLFLPDPPADGWLRVVATAPYRLAVNGWAIDDDAEQLAGLPPFRTKLVIYDLRDVLKRGENVVSLSLTTPSESPRVRADLVATTATGQRIALATGDRWMATSNSETDWRRPSFQHADGWTTCQTDLGFAGVPPWDTPSEVHAFEPAWQSQVARQLKAAGCIVVATACAFLGCALVGWIAQPMAGQVSARVSPNLATLALVPSILAATAALLVEQDSSFVGAPIYQWPLFAVLVAAVVAQWSLILFLATAWTRAPAHSPSGNWPGGLVTSCVLVAVFTVGLSLRLDSLTAEPIHHDEVGAYSMTMGVWQYGYPGGQVHEDMPFGIAATSELVYYLNALAATVFDDPLLVVRVPAVVFSMATLVLAFYVGTRYFNPAAGLLAALFLAVSPYAVGMATFGRYFAQLQFFALLTTYFTFRAVHTNKGIRRGYLWGAAISFVCMYFSWEGSGFLAPPLAAAVLWHRRRRLKSLLCAPSLYLAILFVLGVMAAQYEHRIIQQTQRMWYGSGISEVTLEPMWRYSLFDPEYFLIESSWIRCAVVPMVLLGVATILAIRHPFKRRLQFLLIVLLGNAGLMSALLPLRSARYSFHLSVFFILISAAAVAALTDAMLRLARGARVPSWCHAYAGIVALLCLAVASLFGSGQLVRMTASGQWMTQAYDVAQLRFPDWEGSLAYLRDHLQVGDIVISIMPHVAEYTMHSIKGSIGDAEQDLQERWRTNYWLQTTLVIQSSLGDEQVIPRDRRSGTEMITDLNQLTQIFAKNRRIWYLTTRFGQAAVNDGSVSEFLRRNMDVVYEDFATTLLLRDNNHRPASVQVEDDETAKGAREHYLR
jgi:hypothetical protein